MACFSKEQASFQGVRLVGKAADTLWDVTCLNGLINKIDRHHSNPGDLHTDERLITPGLCHPHIHLDKCFLLSHPKYADLEIKKGDFAEALSLTTKAKSRFQHEDLMERGRVLIEESINFGVTHMRAFCEIDPAVNMKCLDAGLALKEEFKERCFIQICAFAQDPVFSGDPATRKSTALKMELAAAAEGVDVVGSTPYVEKSNHGLVTGPAYENINWIIKLAMNNGKHLDFHMDYNLDINTEVHVNYAIRVLKLAQWPKDKSVTFGHCARLTLFNHKQWTELSESITDLPISFVGLPTSDMFMMGRPKVEDGGSGDGSNEGNGEGERKGGGERVRGTLQIPQMINEYGLSAAIGVNNVGNAFTPQGSCDPLGIAALGVGIYQAGTKDDARLLFECVSTRARAAIGLQSQTSTALELKEGDPANLVVFGGLGGIGKHGFRHRTTVQDLVNDACRERVTIFEGMAVSG